MADYGREWERYRFWRNLLIIAIVGVAPVFWLARFIGDRVHSGYVFGIVAPVWFLFLLSAGAETGYFACPRCGKWFSVGLFYRLGPFARKCAHCGLKRYSNG